MMERRVLLDTNVLVDVVNGSKRGAMLIEILRRNRIEIYTFRKCVYELYSILKGTTKDPHKNNNPLKRFLNSEINDIAQQLFRNDSRIDMLGNTYFWCNLSEEWRCDENLQNRYENIQKYVCPEQREEALQVLETQRKFLLWKSRIRDAMHNIDRILKGNGIRVCEYYQVYASEWYKKKGFFFEKEFARDSLVPNEDFEIIMAAFFLEVKAFITRDNKGLIWRGGLSLGLNVPHISFCCPERIEQAIEDDFGSRCYR